MTRYINTKQNGFVETIFTITAPTKEAINQKAKEQLLQAWKCGINAYISSRTIRQIYK